MWMALWQHYSFITRIRRICGVRTRDTFHCTSTVISIIQMFRGCYKGLFRGWPLGITTHGGHGGHDPRISWRRGGVIAPHSTRKIRQWPPWFATVITQIFHFLHSKRFHEFFHKISGIHPFDIDTKSQLGSWQKLSAQLLLCWYTQLLLLSNVWLARRTSATHRTVWKTESQFGAFMKRCVFLAPYILP